MTEVALSKVCKIRNGFAFKSTEFKNQGVPLIRISSFDDGPVFFDDRTAFVDEDYLDSKKDFLVEKGDILIALSGATTGKYGFYSSESPSLLNQRVGIIKSGRSEKLNSRYFYHYLTILKSRILEKAGGAAQPNISTKQIGEFKIPLPPIPTQKKIAAILDAADAHRQKTKQLLAKYDELAQSIFLEMFGDPVTNPKGWEVTTLKGASERINVGFVGTCDPFYTNEFEGVPMIRTGNLGDGQLRFEKLKYVTKEFHQKQSKSQLKKGDILIARHGDNGKGVVYDGIFGEANCLNIVIVTPKVDSHSYFLEFILNCQSTREFIQRLTGGATQKVINTKALYNVPVYKPNERLIEKFNNMLKSIKISTLKVKRCNENSENLFNSLLQKAFKGELGE
jgi:type I restriction enzyme S subunit